MSGKARHQLSGWTLDRLVKNSNRAHFRLSNRYVTVVALGGARLYCLDSPCFHSAGPLGEGPLEDIEDIPCIRCPWHNFLVALDTGEEVVREVLPPKFDDDGVYRPPQYPLQPASGGKPKRLKPVQRVHECFVDSESQEIVVMIDDSETIKSHPLLSDTNACNEKRGAMSMQIRSIKEAEALEEAANAASLDCAK